MRILIANKFFFRNGGSEVVMFQEREFLSHSGNEVIDFSMKDERNFDSPYGSYFVAQQNYRNQSGGLDKIKSALTLIHSPESVRKIKALIAETRPDILHCHNIYHQLTPSIIGAAKGLGIPVVLTLHDFKPVCPVYNRLRGGQPCSACLDGDIWNVLHYRCADGSLGRSALLYAEALIQRWMGNYEKIDRYLAPSRFMEESVLHRFKREQVTLLYNGVDVNALRCSDKDEGYVLYLGRLSEEKGIETLLHAHQGSGGVWDLVVAGAGPLENKLKVQFKLARFLGHVAGEQLRLTLDRASVIVISSEWFENCPMTVLEAMACGKPVVGSRIGGIPELVLDGETGLLFEPGNAEQLRACLNRLMGNESLRRAMGVAGRQRVESKFSLDEHNRQLMRIYRELTAEET
jgi:glycosyltransferase involved in cell wall biosynthesis